MLTKPNDSIGTTFSAGLHGSPHTTSHCERLIKKFESAEARSAGQSEQQAGKRSAETEPSRGRTGRKDSCVTRPIPIGRQHLTSEHTERSDMSEWGLGDFIQVMSEPGGGRSPRLVTVEHADKDSDTSSDGFSSYSQRSKSYMDDGSSFVSTDSTSDDSGDFTYWSSDTESDEAETNSACSAEDMEFELLDLLAA